MAKILDDIIIIPPDSSELKVRETLWEAFGFMTETDSYHVFWALTYTLKPSEWQWIYKNKRTMDETLGYFRSLLKELKIKGVFVVEYTKKGVPHLHGICIDFHKKLELDQQCLKRGKKFDVYYTIKGLHRSHKLKPIKSKRAYNGWVDYMIKECTPLSILSYFKLSYPLDVDNPDPLGL